MAKSYSDELRLQVVAYINEGHTIRQAAEKFGVSPSFAAKTHKKHAELADIPLLAQVEPAIEPEPSFMDAEITASDLAEMFGVSKRSISDFAERGIIVKTGRNRFSLQKSVHLYCDHLRGIAAGRGGDNADALTVERARLAAEQADNVAMKNAVLRREMVAISDVRNEWVTIGRRLRNEMMSVPSRCRQMLPHLTTFDVDLIDKEIRSALTGLGVKDNDSADDIAEGSVGMPDTAAETEALGLD